MSITLHVNQSQSFGASRAI